MRKDDFDVVVVGSGLAGLTSALCLSKTHRVALISKAALGSGSSAWAQGGIAAVLENKLTNVAVTANYSKDLVDSSSEFSGNLEKNFFGSISKENVQYVSSGLKQTILGGGGSSSSGGSFSSADNFSKRSEETSYSSCSEDSFDKHVQDTLFAGAGLCDEDVVRFIVEQAPECIQWLQEQGVTFSEEDVGVLHRTLEGGHSFRRVVHVSDATGSAIQKVLVDRVRASRRIQVFEGYVLVDLVTDRTIENPAKNLSPLGDLEYSTRSQAVLSSLEQEDKYSKKILQDLHGQKHSECWGLYALDLNTSDIVTFCAPYTILATGGAGQVYLYTSNPETSTGDGIACAWRAGCRVGNLEFVQFHPTCLYHPQAKSFLISEAVRGEGGHLLLPDGTRFMPKYHTCAELAPRDIVARAIDLEMKKYGLECIFLDISYRDSAFIKKYFPNIYQRCITLGIDITRQPIPVVPAAHYSCGGVLTDCDAKTDVEGLYAVGEVAYTGFHGANRLASNSLLECVVMAKAAAQHIQKSVRKIQKTVLSRNNPQHIDTDECLVIAHNGDELRRLMWEYVGIFRTNKRLGRAMRRIQVLKAEVQELYSCFHITKDLLELRNLVQVSELIVLSALSRYESRGAHYNRDYPEAVHEKISPSIINPRSYF